jgi:hypothetical protein
MPRRNTRAYSRRRGSRPFQTDTEVAVSFEALARELVRQGKATISHPHPATRTTQSKWRNGMTAQSDDLRRQAAALLAQAAEVETPMTKEDVHTMYQNKDYDGIEAARRAGRLDDLLTMKTKTKEN